MTDNREEIRLLDAIYDEFQEVAKDLDETLMKNWSYKPSERNEMWTGLVERFSQLTTEAISRGDERTARSYLSFKKSSTYLVVKVSRRQSMFIM